MKITETKQKCTNCIHKEVCSIYDFAKRYNKESSVKFSSYSMADVCTYFSMKKHEQK